MRRSLQRQILRDLQEFWPLVSLPAPKTLPLRRQHLGYSSPFACQVARGEKVTPAALAARVAGAFASKRTVRAKPNGWLEFDLLTLELAQWLVAARANARAAAIPGGVTRLAMGASVGLHQYAHARCCSWLSLGQKTGLWVAEEIAWERLLATSPASQVVLLGILLDLGDRAADIADERITERSPPVAFAEADALRLAAAILAFQQDHPLWGERYRRDLPLARAQLGLIEIARGTLAWLLEVSLALPAPQNL